MATSANSALCNEETTTANLATPVAPLNPKEVPIMLTTATQQMNQGETRALYAKLGNLSDPTWRMVGSVTRTAVGVQAAFLPETASFRPLWKACVRGHGAVEQDLLRVVFGMACDGRGIDQIASGFVTPEARREVRRMAVENPCSALATSCHEAAPCGPAHLRTNYPSWMVNSDDVDSHEPAQS